METDITKTTTTQLKTGVPDYSVPHKVIDQATIQKETYWENQDWPKYAGYLDNIPEYKNAVRSLAIWACGKGWTSPSNEVTATLERINGCGNESFDEIMQNFITTKKTNGDAYLEIMRNDRGTLINIKQIDPSNIRSVWNPKGLIIGYDLKENGEWKRVVKDKILHSMNDRVTSETHGTSVLKACKFVIDWTNEVMSDLRRLMHRSSLRVIYIDVDKTSELNTYREQYKDAIKNGEVLILPGKKGTDVEIVDYPIPPTDAYLSVLQFLNNYFYEVLNVPKVMTGSVQGTTEASSKIGYLVFEQPYMTEQRLLEQDLWNQLGIRVTFERPVSLKEPMQTSEAGNTGQVGFQQSEVMPGRNE